MEVSVEALWGMPAQELLAAYHGLRREWAHKKFARDTERGRLAWQSARLFVSGRGGVTERQNAVEANDELAKKGQHVREMTLELDLLKADIDVMMMALRYRGVAAMASAKLDEPGFGETEQEELAGPP